ncbi:MAG: response regulator transcription factor [Candidatus Nanopelagicaceae bacterium]|nr:response regulator transcription factor [Candidatus Nanopelagicaceae bacterium]
MKSKRATVLLVDDHQVVRAGLRVGLEGADFEVAGEAASKKEAIAQIAHKNPDVIVVDLNLPDGSGLEVVSWARKVSRSIGIVVLTLNDDDSHLLASLQAGASAYVLKSSPLTEVISAVMHAFSDPLIFSAKGLGSAIARKDKTFGLTSREFEVLALLPKGQRSSQIASELFVSEATVKTHLSSIYRKLGVSTRTEAVVTAIRHGLIL